MTDIKEYWAQKEAEIGETVDAKFYCTYISGDESAKGPLTGVLFFSRSALSFQSFFAHKDLKSLFQMHSQKGISGDGPSFRLPLKDLRCTFSQPPQNLWQRLFAPPEQTLDIHLMDGEQKIGNYQFSVDRRELSTIADLINNSAL